MQWGKCDDGLMIVNFAVTLWNLQCSGYRGEEDIEFTSAACETN